MAEELFELNIESENPKISLKFTSRDQIQQFVDRESAHWEWLSANPNNSAPAGPHLWAAIRNSLRTVRNQLTRPEEENEDIKVHIKNALHGLYVSHKYPLSDSPTAMFINSLSEESPERAAAALSALVDGGHIDLGKFEHLTGLVQLIAFQQGISKKTTPAIRKSIEAQKERYREAAQNAEKENEQRVRARDAADMHTRDLLAATIKSLRSKVATTRAIANASIDSAIRQLHETDQTYKEFMKLKAPVEYWNTKAEGHRANSLKYRKFLSDFSIVGGLGLIAAVATIAHHLASIATDDKPAAVYLIWASLAILISTIIFWVARILTRLYLSEHHLGIDAEERAVMVETYLALTAEGEATEQERAIVLSSLFRPTADGIVKDDGAPDLSPAVLFSKFGGKP